jgi:hypothetical protein
MSSAVPSGTVSFLFTDIEGSTRLFFLATAGRSSRTKCSPPNAEPEADRRGRRVMRENGRIADEKRQSHRSGDQGG